MVIRATFEHMMSRPHHERKDFAAACSMVVVGLLFFGWVALFAHNVQSDVAAQASAPVSTSETSNGDNTADALSSLTKQIQTVRTSYSQTVTPSSAPQIINIDSLPAASPGESQTTGQVQDSNQ